MLSLMVLSALERSLNALKQRFDSTEIKRSWYFKCKARLIQQPLRNAKRLSSDVCMMKVENHLPLLFLTVLLRVFVPVESDVRDGLRVFKSLTVNGRTWSQCFLFRGAQAFSFCA